jgi:hypothetical protein
VLVSEDVREGRGLGHPCPLVDQGEPRLSLAHGPCGENARSDSVTQPLGQG